MKKDEKKFGQYQKRLYLCTVNLRNKTPTTMQSQVYKSNERRSRSDRLAAAVVGAAMTGDALFIHLLKSYHNENKFFRVLQTVCS